MGENSEGQQGWTITEVASVPGSGVATCRVRSSTDVLRVGDHVTTGREVSFEVAEILHGCFQFDQLDEDTEGQVILRGSLVGLLKPGLTLQLGGPAPS